MATSPQRTEGGPPAPKWGLPTVGTSRQIMCSCSLPTHLPKSLPKAAKRTTTAKRTDGPSMRSLPRVERFRMVKGATRVRPLPSGPSGSRHRRWMPWPNLWIASATEMLGHYSSIVYDATVLRVASDLRGATKAKAHRDGQTLIDAATHTVTGRPVCQHRKAILSGR